MNLSSTTIPVGRDGPGEAHGRYDVLIGHRVLDGLTGLLGESARRVLLVHPRALRSVADAVRRDVAAAGLRPVLAEVPDAEDAKTVEVLATCWRLLGEAGFTRTDVVVGLGGGAPTDLAGFVAAAWLRGLTAGWVPSARRRNGEAPRGGHDRLQSAQG